MVDDTPDHVLATYREIAERFGLGTVRAARTKVKRAGWTHDPPNHPSDPLHIRVPRGPWQQAGTAAPDRPHDALGSKDRDPRHRADEVRSDQSRDAAGIKGRGPGQQRRDTHGINGLDALLTPLREQLDRERARADAAEAELSGLRERVAELRELRAAADARAGAAEARVDDLMAQVQKLAEAQARADLLQVEADRSRAEADRLRAELAAAGAGPINRRRWFSWRRRPP